MRITAQILQRPDGWFFRWRHITNSGQAIDITWPDVERGAPPCETIEDLLIAFQRSVRDEIPVGMLQGDENYDNPKGTPALKLWWKIETEGDEPAGGME